MNKNEIEKVLKENLKEMRSLKFNRGMDFTIWENEKRLYKGNFKSSTMVYFPGINR